MCTVQYILFRVRQGHFEGGVTFEKPNCIMADGVYSVFLLIDLFFVNDNYGKLTQCNYFILHDL